METPPSREPKLSVWIVTLNRQIHRDEYAICVKYIEERAQQKAKKYKDHSEAFRYVMGSLLPSLVMRNQNNGLSPHKWYIKATSSGKEYLHTVADSKVLGFSTGWAESAVAIGYSYGRKSQIVNIGIDIMLLTLPRDVSAGKYVEAFAHKLTQNEDVLLDRRMKDDVILRRLCILLTLKTAYIKALGQPTGFDYGRIDCDIPQEVIKVDGKVLKGWEFRLFKANLGVVRKGLLIEEAYQCTTAMYRGWDKTVFVWEEDQKETARWLDFIPIDLVLSSLSPKSSESKASTS